MESSAAPQTATAKRLWHIVRTVFVMLREGLAKRRGLSSVLRLHFLFRQSKLAGKSLRSLLSHHHPSSSLHATAVETFSCRFMDPDAAIFAPGEVEFSCSNTPLYASSRRRTHHLAARRRRRHNLMDAAAVARAFEILDSVPDNEGPAEEMPTPMMSVLATPAASVRPLRVTDSPFPVKEEEDEEEEDQVVDREAEEFIRQFYEQLRRQQMRSY